MSFAFNWIQRNAFLLVRGPKNTLPEEAAVSWEPAKHLADLKIAIRRLRAQIAFAPNSFETQLLGSSSFALLKSPSECEAEALALAGASLI